MRFEIATPNVGKAAVAFRNGAKTLRQAQGRTAVKHGAKMISIIRRESRGAPETTATATRTRTGHLRNQVNFQVTPTGDGVSLEVGWIKSRADSKTLVYAATHEYGAHIKPKRARALAIPLEAALTPNGVARGLPRDFTDTFILRGHGKHPLIMQKRGKSVVPLFVLVPSVRIKARPSLVPAFLRVREDLKSDLAANFQQSVAF